MATQTSLPSSHNPETQIKPLKTEYPHKIRDFVPDVPSLFAPPVLTTVYSFPSLTPLQFVPIARDLLGLPLRKDILHRAVVYEGDMTRQGTANTKWRSEVHGSNRKIRPQKGTGRARLGNKKSPMLRGGGVAFGPKPRDFATKLPKKVYDLAWLTALSYRYRRGELVVVNNLHLPEKGLREGSEKYWLQWCLANLKWGYGNGRSMLVTLNKNEKNENFINTLNNERGLDGQARSLEDLDVKNLLEMGRVVIEWGALNKLLRTHARSPATKELRMIIPSVEEELTEGESAVNVELAEEEELGCELDFLKSDLGLDEIFDLAKERKEDDRAR
jgi:large subunit ribosomal protein L4